MTDEPQTPEEILKKADPDHVYQDQDGRIFEIYLPEQKEKTPPQRSERSIIPYLLIGLIVLAGIAYFWFKKKDGNTDENNRKPTDSPNINDRT